MIDTNQTLGALATDHPGATAVFLRHQLDFCCGGRQPLGDACTALGLDTDAVVAELNALSEESGQVVHWASRPVPELIQHILEHYHEPLRQDLPGLIAAAEKVERVHAKKASCPRGLATHLHELQTGLLNHMSKEEKVLFPALLSGKRGHGIEMPVRVLMREHDEHGADLKRTRELAANFEPPAEACATWRALCVALEKLESGLMEHIHLENNVLFPRALGE